MDPSLAIDFSRKRDSSGSEPAPWKPVRFDSAAVCASLRCLLLVVIISRSGPDARFVFVLRKRFLNLGGRGRAADQTLASETLVSLRPDSGISDRLKSDQCVFPCVGSQPVLSPLQGGMDDLTGIPDVEKLENSPPKDQRANKSQSGSLNCGRIRRSGSVRSCTVGSRRVKRVASRRGKRVA